MITDKNIQSFLRDVESKPPKSTPYKRYVQQGLCLHVYLRQSSKSPVPKVRSVWVQRFADAATGKEQSKVLGRYPDVSLKAARTRSQQFLYGHAEFIAADAAGAAKPVVRLSPIPKSPPIRSTSQIRSRLLGDVYADWFDHEKQRKRWSDRHARKIASAFRDHVLPFLGQDTLGTITALSVRDVVKKLEQASKFSIAKDVSEWLASVFRYAALFDSALPNPAQLARSQLVPHQEQHQGRVSHKHIGAVLHDGLEVTDDHVHRHFFVLLALTALRVSELSALQWDMINYDELQIEMPARVMKGGKRNHVVPLTPAMLVRLRELQSFRLHERYVFPNKKRRGSARGQGNPVEPTIHGNAVRNILQRAGFGGYQTAHGLRGVFSTWANDLWHGQYSVPVERQLAHQERDQVMKAYNLAEHLPIRREIMAAWSTFIENELEKASQGKRASTEEIVKTSNRWNA